MKDRFESLKDLSQNHLFSKGQGGAIGCCVFDKCRKMIMEMNDGIIGSGNRTYRPKAGYWTNKLGP